ncbi:MAG: hypothetical protein A2Y15_00305 [Clostridiales bacterium GWF2_36_10]|nr:MAG: hypothetical protein A2Y15_00305 [Clostridiales bacterium GWF2_36_10]HAN21768.1 hypothetical protein [Clostridiales bacterium]
MGTKRKTKKEGRRIKTLPPISRVAPYIMKTRQDASNSLGDSLEIGKCDEFIYKKREQGLKGFGMLHLFIAAYIRILSQRPALNRFIRGQQIFARNCVEIMLTIKKEMKIESPDTVLKLFFPIDATSDQVYKIITEAIEASRAEESEFDNLAKVFNYIPGLFLKFTVWLLNLLDYFGLIPRSLTKLSPFHGSFAITSMGSLGIPPVYHHLYDFGNIPVFCAFGAKYTKNELQLDGSVKQFKYVDYKFTTDERICDGHYFAAAFKLFKTIMKDPQCLDLPPETVVEEIP